jgi:hypothetical protein
LETLIFLIGALVGLFLGLLLYSLLDMAQKADKLYDLLEYGKVTATPVDTYYLPASETMLPTRRQKKRPSGD